jgi:hypothetical protein
MTAHTVRLRTGAEPRKPVAKLGEILLGIWAAEALLLQGV